MKAIGLDIETANLDMRMENLHFNNPYGWETSCICIYDGENQEGRYYVKDRDLIIEKLKGVFDEHPVKNQIIDSLYNFTDLKQHLQNYYDMDYTLITHNGLSFDLPILSKTIENGGADVLQQINLFKEANKNVDTCEHLRKHTGYRFKLQNLIKGILGDSEGKFMESSNAPKQWAKGNYLKVLGYCMGDSIYTYEIYNAVRQTGEFKAKVRHNKKEFECEVLQVRW